MKGSPIRDLIDYLVIQRRYVKLEELCTHFGVSRRTIFYRIRQANQLLTQNNIPKIKNERGAGYLLDPQSIKLWRALQANLHQEDQSSPDQEPSSSRASRIRKILWLMIIKDTDVSINDLAVGLKVSRNTIINDFKLIQQQYPQLKVQSTVNGHQITCIENQIRRYVFHELQQDIHGYFAQQIQQLTFPVVDQGQAKKDFQQLEHEIQSKFTENAYWTLILILKFSIYRLSLGHLVTQTATTVGEINQITKSVVPAVRTFLKVNGVNDPHELVFFTELVLGSQVSSINYIRPEFQQTMITVTKQIIMRYDQIAGTRINSAEFIQALSNHLFATYFRCKFNFEFSSSVLKAIEDQFSNMIKFVQIACQPLANMIGKPISVNEIALICLYFISYDDVSNDNLTTFLDQTGEIKESLEAEVLLVCTSGVSTSALLYSTLHRRYPLINFSRALSIEKLAKIMRMPNKAKLIITTAPLNQANYGIPTIYVQSVLSARDGYKVEQVLRKYFPQLSINQENSLNNIIDIIQQSADIHDLEKLKHDLLEYLFPTDHEKSQHDGIRLSDLITTDQIKIFKDSQLNLKQIIRQLCWILTNKNITTPEYADDIIQLIDQYGPYMLVSADTFLAHAAPSDHTQRVGVAIGILQQPLHLQINDKEVALRCVILLSPGYHHEHDQALAELINIITNQPLYQQVLNAQSSKEAAKLIQTIY
ncbi:BglG family transcription antiterminator [uncultured Limosilactobacillus sp.]|uniref:BglG family transcription antiterminator n=1 Tax=uncultured Limosilactobacillus sp. TaxID=2837629 RepID=UPI0025E4532B|nr:PTS sugar transporter subunit IIA [uncultured Limosilactobacillus sp.]